MENKQIGHRFAEEVLDNGNYDRIEELVAEDFVDHTPFGEPREAMPDLHREVDDVIATDEKAVIRYTLTGTQEGEFEGAPPTGEEMEIAGVGISRIEDGKLAEARYVQAMSRAMIQLGIVESPSE